eukprot:3420330-Amphidinium_carterae.1
MLPLVLGAASLIGVVLPYTHLSSCDLAGIVEVLNVLDIDSSISTVHKLASIGAAFVPSIPSIFPPSNAVSEVMCEPDYHDSSYYVQAWYATSYSSTYDCGIPACGCSKDSVSGSVSLYVQSWVMLWLIGFITVSMYINGSSLVILQPFVRCLCACSGLIRLAWQGSTANMRDVSRAVVFMWCEIL